MTLEQRIEAAAGSLPEGWSINIEVEKGCGLVRLIRPDGSELIVCDGEGRGIVEYFRDAEIIAFNETLQAREQQNLQDKADGMAMEPRCDDFSQI